eukprot:2965705-Rhodomonas_salina.1
MSLHPSSLSLSLSESPPPLPLPLLSRSLIPSPSLVLSARTIRMITITAKPEEVLVTAYYPRLARLSTSLKATEFSQSLESLMPISTPAL